jgi:hypothetical protein
MQIKKKYKIILITIAAVLVVLYVWEYYCVLRPVGICSSLCEKRDHSFQITFSNGKKIDAKGSTCAPWYRWFWRRDF